MVNSLTGQLIDAWTLTKPPGWQPNQTAQLESISLFIANYTPSVWALQGINGDATNLIQGAAEALLLSEPEQLELLRNWTYVANPNHPDHLAYQNEIYSSLMDIYETQIAGTAAESPAAKYFWQNYFKPVWQLFQDHPDGLIKGPELGSAFPSATATDATVAAG